MKTRFGIDLGTTYSAISWYDWANTCVELVDLDSADGLNTLRSAVYYEPGGGIVVGPAAHNAAKDQPDRVITGAKRGMGEAWQTQEIDGKQYSAEEVSCEILKTLAQDTKPFAGVVEDVVITVPAFFGDNQKEATLRAGELAGLNVLALLEEPHAAVLAFAIDRIEQVQDRHLLVYDLGGGTFDVALVRGALEEVEVAEGPSGASTRRVGLELKTVCCDGARELGGLDWDKRLAELVRQKVLAETQHDPRADPMDAAVLLDNCEKAKRDLGKLNSVEVVADLQRHRATVTRAEFEESCADLLDETRQLLENVLTIAEEDHAIPRDEIDVILCGGSTRMPMVQDMVRAVMGKDGLEFKNPELMVATGAAYAAHLYGASAVPGEGGPDEVGEEDRDVKTTDRSTGEKVEVTMGGGGLVRSFCKPVGVQSAAIDERGNLMRDENGEVAWVNSVLIPGGGDFGEESAREDTWETSEDGMTEIPVTLWEGDDTDLSKCRRLATVTISQLPPDRPAGQQVRIRLWYDSNGIIKGEATDLATETRVEIDIDRSKPLD